MAEKKQTSYRLGVDIGTGSVAWAAFEVNSQGPQRLMASSTVIFGEPVLPKEMKLKNEQRRHARLLRRQVERKKERISKIMHIAAKLEITPEKLATALLAQKETQQLWLLRIKALDQKISLEEYFLIVLRLAKNRGYNGDIPKAKKSGDLGKVASALTTTQTIREAHKEARTVAEAIWLNQSHTALNQKKFRKLADTGTYVLRKDILDEFDQISREQIKHHPALLNALDHYYPELQSKEKTLYFWDQQPATLLEALKVAVFYQRPLHAFTDLIGACSLEPEEKRVVAAHPAHQAFRIEKLLADLRWGDNKTGEKLSAVQKDFLRVKLESTAEPSFSAIYKELDKAGLMHPDGLIFNFHTPRRDTLRGNSTRSRLKSLGMLAAFDAMSENDQDALFVALANDVLAPESWGHDQAKESILQQYGETIVLFLDELAASENGLDRLKGLGFEAGRVSYGATALKRLSQVMREQGLDEFEAISLLYPSRSTHSTPTGELKTISDLNLRSPVVEHALDYTRRELLNVVRRFGPPQAMVIELAKEVKSTLEQRDATTKRQNQEERDNKEAREEIAKANCKITNTAILRYKLWKQQAKTCPYSGQIIGSVEEAVSGTRYEIEHILPKKLHGVGNRFEDVVLASKQFNGLKSGHETPFLAAQRLGAQKWNWETTEQAIKVISRAGSAFKAKAKIISDKTPFRLDALDDEAFIDRQLQETQWIGRIVQQWCSQLCSDVTVIRGGLTAELRRAWGFHTLLEEVRIAEGKHNSEKAATLFYKANRLGEPVFDKRSDHRHHMIDACVIALSTRQNYTAAVKARNARATGQRSNYEPPACPIPNLRQHLLKTLQGYCIWHVPDRLVSGLMFDQMPFSLDADGKTLRKDGKVSNNKFSPKMDRLITHQDRQGREHKKALRKSEAACMRVTDELMELVTIADFQKKYIRAGKLTIPKNERLIFKGDLLVFTNNNSVFRVAQLKESAGICAVIASETQTFDNLMGTGLNRKFGKISDLQKAKVINHPIELVEHIRATRTSQ
jgi:CRISPR-associated endonuclease Csn1